MTFAWTCPFCALLCDRYTVAQASPLRLQDSDCPRANEALRHFDAAPAADASPTIAGTPVALDAALDAAARALQAAKQPLFGGLATDVAGMRALYRLAARSGAIVDHAHGDAMQHGLRALQDRGQFTTTLAEIRERADLLVCIGALPGEAFPEFWRRCGIGSPGSALRRIVFVGTRGADPRLAAPADVAVDAIPSADDLHTTLSLLNAIVGGWHMRQVPPAALVRLAQQLTTARYAVLAWEARTLDAQGALIVEALQRLVDRLNLRTRAASFTLGGNDGAATAQQVVGWLSGLPLRTRVSNDALEHEPVRFAATRLLDDKAVDALLWVASFGPQLPPPETPMPRIVLGHPALADVVRGGRHDLRSGFDAGHRIDGPSLPHRHRRCAAIAAAVRRHAADRRGGGLGIARAHGMSDVAQGRPRLRSDERHRR